MSEAPASRARPGRPDSGARERILEACLEVLKADGYAGLTIAKVAARAGENKALISYHFGSKQGVVTAAARELGEMITRDVLAGVEGANTIEDVLRGTADGIWTILERDVRLSRAYFDLNAVSVVEDEISSALRQIKTRWREVLSQLLLDAGVGRARVPAATTFVVVAMEGFCLEWIERGDTAELRLARDLFVTAGAAALA